MINLADLPAPCPQTGVYLHLTPNLWKVGRLGTDVGACTMRAPLGTSTQGLVDMGLWRIPWLVRFAGGRGVRTGMRGCCDKWVPPGAEAAGPLGCLLHSPFARLHEEGLLRWD